MKNTINKKPTTKATTVNTTVTEDQKAADIQKKCLFITDRIDAFVQSQCYNNGDVRQVWFGCDEEVARFNIGAFDPEDVIPCVHTVTVAGIYGEITVTATLIEYVNKTLVYSFDIED
jgi:hypothetical protein